MIRLQIPQITTSHYMPGWFKNLVHEFLDHIVNLVNANRPFLPLVQEAVNKGAKHIYLYAPETGGSSALLASDISANFPDIDVIILNDHLSKERLQHFVYLGQSSLSRFPTQSLQDAVQSDSLVLSINHAHQLSDADFLRHVSDLKNKFDYIILGEGNNKSVRQVIGMTIIVPLVILLMSLFIKPLRFSRLIFTYIVPILPLAIVWDGVAALFRIRSPELLQVLVSKLDGTSWIWNSGKLPNNRGGFIIYLQGNKNKA